jgi:TRAP-type uncharacterized transport system fused permease subunit
LWIGLPGYALAAVPLAGVIPAVATYLGLTTAVHRYARWSLEQEMLRRPLRRWEKLLLAGFAVLTLIVVVGLVLLAALVGWSLTALIDWVRAGY